MSGEQGRTVSKGEVENSEFSGNSETSENQFSEVFHSEFPIWHNTQHRKLGLKTSECSLRHFDQTPRFSNSEFSILHYTQNGKLGVENLRVFHKVYPNNDIFY